MSDGEQKLRVRLVGKGWGRRCDPGSKKWLVAAYLEPGVSISGLSLKHGINANLLRKWVKDGLGLTFAAVAGDAFADSSEDQLCNDDFNGRALLRRDLQSMNWPLWQSAFKLGCGRALPQEIAQPADDGADESKGDIYADPLTSLGAGGE